MPSRQKRLEARGSTIAEKTLARLRRQWQRHARPGVGFEEYLLWCTAEYGFVGSLSGVLPFSEFTIAEQVEAAGRALRQALPNLSVVTEAYGLLLTPIYRTMWVAKEHQ